MHRMHRQQVALHPRITSACQPVSAMLLSLPSLPPNCPAACCAIVTTPQVVPPSQPRERDGLYWGYTVRLAQGLSGLLHESTFKGGYDLKIGTSERGQVVAPGNLQLPRFKHVLVAFGGPGGLEEAAEHDKQVGGRDTSELFGLYLNTCPQQGSRTIRTEEAILISVSFLETALRSFGR
eukprot:GHRQ01035418.1.p1 GENE.GHRQ01035418.1~~GHRQ01035418.1.p1  ORF type:complete len:179 (-),score=32.14 GHRQ01035418.1:157-693(-)